MTNRFCLGKAFGLVLTVVCLLIPFGAWASSQDSQPETSSQFSKAGQTPSMIYALSVGKEDTPEKSTARFSLLSPLLGRLVGSEASSACYQFADNKPSQKWSSRLVPDAQKLGELLAELYKVKANNITNYPVAFKEGCKTISERVLVSETHETQLWFIEQRAPLFIQLKENNEAQNSNDPLKEAADLLLGLRERSPGLKIHFVYVDSGTPTVINPMTVRFDKYLKNRLSSEVSSETSEEVVYTHDLSLGTQNLDMGQENTILGIVRRQWNALAPSLPARDIRGDLPNEWLLEFEVPFTEEPGGFTALALIEYPENGAEVPALSFTPLTQSKGTDFQVRDEEADNSEVPGLQIVETISEFEGSHLFIKGETSAWLIMRSLPAGKYVVRLAFTSQISEDVKPVLSVYPVTPPRRAWIQLAAQADQSWLRDENEIHIYTDALDVPIDQWEVVLLMNGLVLPTDITPSVADEVQPYHWIAKVPSLLPGFSAFKAQLSMKAPGMMALETQTEEINVFNRPPELRREPTTVKVFYDIPAGDSQGANQSTNIDLNRFFADPDGDILTFAILGPRDYSQRYQARILGNELLYTPLYGSGEITLYIAAFDSFLPKGLTPLATAKISMEQISLRELMESWRFSLVPQDDQAANQDEQSAVRAVNQAVELNFRFEGEEARQALAIYQEASQKLNFKPVEQALQISMTLGDGPKTECQLIQEVDDEGRPLALLITCSLPAFNQSEELLLAFSASYQGFKFDHMVPSITLKIENSPPRLCENVQAAQTIGGEIKGSFGNLIPKNLSELLGQKIDLYDLFEDDDTPDSLSFIVWAEGKGFTVSYNDQKIDPQATPVDGKSEYLLKSVAYEDKSVSQAQQKRQALLDITFKDVGDIKVSVKAQDNQTLSEHSVEWNIKLTSAFVKLVRTILFVALGVLIILIITLVLIRIIKPSFKGLTLMLASVNNKQNANQAKWTSVALDTYGKKNVPLSTLLIACRQPPLEKLDMKTLTQLSLQPARNSQVRIVCKSKAIKNSLKLDGKRFSGKKNLECARAFIISKDTSEALHLQVGDTEGRNF